MQVQQLVKKPENVTVERFHRVTPLSELKNFILGDEHGKVEVYSGDRVVQNVGITVHGSGVWGIVHVSSHAKSYDYKALYQLYNVPEDISADYWFIEYRKHEDHGELKKVYESSQEIPIDIVGDFMIQGNDYDIESVFVTIETIRLTVDGISEDFIVNNPASAKAITPSGDPYPGGFKPVTK